MNRGYISEFSRFMEAFLHEHPDIVADQRRGWLLFWKPGDKP